MPIRIWQAFSCNNSSSYRLVARFADATAAKAAADELAAFLSKHAAQVDEAGEYDDAPSQAQRDLARKYGFAWTEVMYWGDTGLVGDEPDVLLHDEVLIVHHSYCGGGLGAGIPAYLAARGAQVEPETSADLQVSVLFRCTPGANPRLDAELRELFRRTDDNARAVSLPPWAGDYERYGDFAFFRDAGTVGLYFPLDPRDLEKVTTWLGERGIENASLQIDEPDVERTFRAIAEARCRSCEGPLDYLDPRLHDIESPQLVCKPCGGFYELSAFLA